MLCEIQRLQNFNNIVNIISFKKKGFNKKRHISMLKVKLYFFSSFLVEVVHFFVTYDLARNKTGSVKYGMTELYKKKQKKHTHT